MAAMQRLEVKLSRRVAKEAVADFRANTAPAQYKELALFACAKFSGSTMKLPTRMGSTLPARMTCARKRQQRPAQRI